MPVATKINAKAESAYHTVIRSAIDIVRRGRNPVSGAMLRSLFEHVADAADGVDQLVLVWVVHF